MGMSRVLIIDDERDILESLSSVLEDEGFQVLKAANGVEGLAVFERDRPDVVLLDVWMPEMDGLEVLARIKQESTKAVVIVISGHGTISTAVEAVKMGAYDFLEKPLHVDKVLEVVNRGLARDVPLQEPVEDFRIETSAGSHLFRQRTIEKSTVVYGMGLHSGTKTGMILFPMPVNTGIVFEHVPDGERIPAYVDYVYSVGYASSVKGKNCVVRTIEHLLATLHMFGITNLLVKVSEEVPIFDGSALEMCRKIEEAGLADQTSGIEPLRIDRLVALTGLGDGRHLSIEPSDGFEVDYTLDHAKPIGFQQYHFHGNAEDFVREIAPARTFGFIKDFERLSSMGLASGGRINNVIILSDDEVVNTKLRFTDEFVRHKILDVMGDLYLLNRPVLGKVVARQTGHLENIGLVRELKRLYIN
jgi:UDP-3-O-[3-hydroxymyristoyl] N-acetylglucosamine deacetylase